MALPTLYAKSKTGKDQVWNIEVIGNMIRTSYGYKDGAITVNEKTVDKGKNIGKKNETTPEQQAAAEARSLWDKKKTTGYGESVEASVVPQMGKQEMEQHGKILPMLCPSQAGWCALYLQQWRADEPHGEGVHGS